MSDPRHQYVAVRLEAALDGIKYSPSIVSVFDNAKVQEELAKFYAANGPPCIAFTVDRTPDEETQQHKLSFYSGAPKSKPDTSKCVYFTRANPAKAVDIKTVDSDLLCGEKIGRAHV